MATKAQKLDISATLDVVVLCYNEENTIASCLEALKTQERLRSIIVVDNNSSDNSVKIVKKQAKKDSRIILLHEKRQGAVYARETGFNAAKTDVVARIDADTRVRPGWSEAILEYYKENPSISAATGDVRYDDIPFRTFVHFIGKTFFVHVSGLMHKGQSILYGANMSIRRSAWNEVSKALPYDKEHMEDLAIQLALQDKGHRIGFIVDAPADVSLRRMRTTPKALIQYNNRAVNTYTVMGKPRQAMLLKPMFLLFNVGNIAFSYLLRFYNPDTQRFQWKPEDFGDRTLP